MGQLDSNVQSPTSCAYVLKIHSTTRMDDAHIWHRNSAATNAL
jgi:hypothetical protein